MSAALQLPVIWGATSARQPWIKERTESEEQFECKKSIRRARNAQLAEPLITVAFYRKHTESMLRRYLYASMQVGRSPAMLGDSVGRGWASSRPIRTFEDAVIFVLDVEMCLNKLGSLDRQMLSRIVLQEYTQAEAATLLGMSVRAISYKFPAALDRLTQHLLEASLLILPK
jgi:hypothetical protein